MIIVFWNCNNGISDAKQITYFQTFKADLAILPELKKSNIQLLSPSSSIWITNNHKSPTPKGLGILGFNGVILEELPRDDDMEIYVPVTVSFGAFSFTLLAVWNFYYACKQGRFKGVRGEECLEWSALRHYKSIFKDPCLVGGDWNFGPHLIGQSKPSYDLRAYPRLVKTLSDSGLKNLYYAYSGKSLGEEEFVSYRSVKGRNPHVLDHIFGSKTFAKSINSFRVDTLDNVVFSDHAPLILDIAL